MINARINKIKDQIKNSALYLAFRKIRFSLHLIPTYRKIKEFIKHYFGGLTRIIDDNHVFLLGGGLAFSLFVCIIPFVLIIFAVLGNVLDSTNMQYQINLLIDTIIPYYKYSEFVKNIIFVRINEVIEYRNIAGLVGGFGLLIAASGLFSSMRTILNRIFRTTTNVNVLLGKLKDFALVLMVILIFFITTILMPVLEVLRQYASKFRVLEFFESGVFEHLIFSLISVSIIFIVFASLYYIVPTKKLGKKATLISALWAALLWETAKQLFGFYLYNYSAFGKIYGTYALIIVVAFWIYYSSIVFIIGAGIGRLYQDRRYALLREEEIIN